MSMMRYFAMGGAVAKTYIEDVFSTYLYTGNGSSQVINNGIALASSSAIDSTEIYCSPSAYDTLEYKSSLTEVYQVVGSTTTGLKIVRFDSGVKIFETLITNSYGSYNVSAKSIKENNGYLYVYGSINPSVGKRAFISKIDKATGTNVWSKQYGVSTYSTLSSILFSGTNIIVCFEGNSGSDSSANIVQISDANGTVGAKSQLSYSTSSSWPSEVASDSSGNIYVCGYTNADGSWKTFIAKYNSSLVHQWTKDIAGSDTGVGACMGSDGTTLYIVGKSSTTGYITSLNASAGTVNWQKTMTVESGSILDHCFESSGTLYIAGSANTSPNKGYIAALNTSTQSFIFQQSISHTDGIRVKGLGEVSSKVYVSGHRNSGSYDAFSIMFDGSNFEGTVGNLVISPTTIRTLATSANAIAASLLVEGTMTLAYDATLNATFSSTSLVTNASFSEEAVVGAGGMVWIKERSTGTDASSAGHQLTDTERGTYYRLATNGTGAQNNPSPFGLTSFSATGFSVNDQNSPSYGYSEDASTYASWTFKKAAKFFDVVTYTGDGAATKTLSHSLGQTPGMIVVKKTSATGDWSVWHRSLSGQHLVFNTTAAATGVNDGWGTHTATQFIVGGPAFGDINNDNGATYIAYLFAHDTGADGLIQCGIANAGETVSLGWEPQWILTKSGVTQSITSDWLIEDTVRGLIVDDNGTINKTLAPNVSTAEANAGVNMISINATGFKNNNGTYHKLYVAIRRGPMKQPTVGTQVYNAIARNGTSATATVTGVGFAPDLVTSAYRPGGNQRTFFDRLRGANSTLLSTGTNAEDNAHVDQLTGFDVMDGIRVGADAWYGSINISSGIGVVTHFFRRYPGVLDIVCYTGTGLARTVSHNLGTVPELIIGKDRTQTFNWYVYHSSLGNTKALYLNGTDTPVTGAYLWNDTTPTSSVFTLGTSGINVSGDNFVAYLFATKAGISKVGSYTGDGTSGQTIDAGFSAGARFVLIKRTDSTGDWFVFDSTRGIVAANDPHLSLNTTVAEVTTDDSVDPAASGFIVNQNATTNLNVTSATYIYLAIS